MLKEILAAMEVKEYNNFRIRAYQNAISILEGLTVSIYDLWENKGLKEIPGIGPSIENHLNEFFTEGFVKEFEEIKSGLPEGMFSLIGLRGIGAKRAFKLSVAFNLKNREDAIEKLKEAAESGAVKVLEGFGEKMETSILEAIEEEKLTKNKKKEMNMNEVFFRSIYDYKAIIQDTVGISRSSFRTSSRCSRKLCQRSSWRR